MYLPGHKNVWADTLSCFAELSVEWRLIPQMFRMLTERVSLPEIDMFPPPVLHLLPLYLTK